MFSDLSRRNWLKLASAALPLAPLKLSAALLGVEPANTGSEHIQMPVSDIFPSYPPELVRELVTVAHFDLKRVKEIVESHTSLAKAAWDWGFGDCETALGAASHMGNKPIAEYLLSQGAQPSLFCAAMFGQLEVVKAFVAAQPGVQRIRGPHGISLLAHARMGGEAARATFEFLQSLGDADAELPVSLSEVEAGRLVGTYIFGMGVTQQVEVNTDLKMYVNSKMYAHSPQLNWTRKSAMTRPLFHLGDHTFYPAGAPSVRIRFTEDAGAVVMTVSDGDLQVTARRKEESK
jgi:hypothetical protein